MRFHSGLKKLDSFFRPSCPCNFKFLPPLLVIRNEELLDLRQQSFADVGYGVQILVIVGMNGDSEQSIIGLSLPVFCLLGLNDTLKANVDKTADVGRRIHKHHDVDGVAIIPES
jgi:hypothetical protein